VNCDTLAIEALQKAWDGFDLMCIHYDQPDGAPPPRARYRDRQTARGGGSWQSA